MLKGAHLAVKPNKALFYITQKTPTGPLWASHPSWWAAAQRLSGSAHAWLRKVLKKIYPLRHRELGQKMARHQSTW